MAYSAAGFRSHPAAQKEGLLAASLSSGSKGPYPPPDPRGSTQAGCILREEPPRYRTGSARPFAWARVCPAWRLRVYQEADLAAGLRRDGRVRGHRDGKMSGTVCLSSLISERSAHWHAV